ncbi:penicillin acylase family protein [Nocardioides pacificus]
MARIFRDAWAIPHVRGSSVLDVAHGQGVAMARDRSWQLEHQRRRATGTSAELLGLAAVPADRLARRAGIAEIAQRAHGALDEETRAFVASYVRGVNDALHTDSPEFVRLGVAPAAWEPWTPIAVFLSQHLLFANLTAKLWRTHARRMLGEEAALLSHEGPSSSGSNAWAVGGDRTASGSPLVAGDPHRLIEAPGVYAQVRLACDEFDVVGFAFPGVPGIQHFGHAGSVAWAITNAMGDTQDLFDEQLRRVDDGRVEALGPDGWEPTRSHLETVLVRGADPAAVEVVVTARGRVVSGGVDGGGDGGAISLRTPPDVLGACGFDALLPLLRSRTADDVDAALGHWVEPVNNVLVADAAGTVRYRVAGRVPLRAEANRQTVVPAEDAGGGWTGWLADALREEVAPDGHAVTANERRGPQSDRIGVEFAPPHRAQRLHQLVAGRTGLRVEDLEAMHGDTLLLAVPLFQRHLRGLALDEVAPGSRGQEVRAEIVAWDGHLDTESRGAAAFAAWRSALTARLLAERPLADLAATPAPYDEVFGPWLSVPGRVGLALEALVAADRPFGIDVARLSARALEDAAGHRDTWGATHVLTPVHAFEVADADLDPPPLPAPAVPGDSDTVRCTSSVPGVSDECWRGSVARYVWDLADRCASRWVVPLGAAGDPRSPHHTDQQQHWLEARLVPIVTDWTELTEELS